MNEYKEASAHKKERNNSIEKHNEKIRLFLDATSEKILNIFEQKSPSIVEWSRLSVYGTSVSVKSNDLEIIFKETAHIIKGAYEGKPDIDSGWRIFRSEKNQWGLSANHFAIEGFSTESEIKEIKHEIDIVLKNASKGEDFNNLKKYYKNTINNHKLFVDGINQIRKEVQSDIPLKGLCKICRNY